MHCKGTTQLPGRQSAAVEAKTVPFFAGRKAMAEDAPQILRRNAHPIVRDRDLDASRRLAEAHRQLAVRPAGFRASVFVVV